MADSLLCMSSLQECSGLASLNLALESGRGTGSAKLTKASTHERLHAELARTVKRAVLERAFKACIVDGKQCQHVRTLPVLTPHMLSRLLPARQPSCSSLDFCGRLLLNHHVHLCTYISSETMRAACLSIAGSGPAPEVPLQIQSL